MENDVFVQEILKKSNFDSLKDSMSNFVKIYIEKLVENISLYVDSSIIVQDIVVDDKYVAEQELSQNITGYPSAYSAIDGDPFVLAEFAEKYAKLGIDSFDMLAKEALVDFLNLHNGLFIVQLSKLNLCELSLEAPKQSGPIDLKSEISGKITVVPVRFSFGTVKFLLYELPE